MPKPTGRHERSSPGQLDDLGKQQGRCEDRCGQADMAQGCGAREADRRGALPLAIVDAT